MKACLFAVVCLLVSNSEIRSICMNSEFCPPNKNVSIIIFMKVHKIKPHYHTFREKSTIDFNQADLCSDIFIQF